MNLQSLRNGNQYLKIHLLFMEGVVGVFSNFTFPSEQWKNPGCLGYIGDYTTQLYRDYSKPLLGYLLTNQYNGK